MSKKNPGAIALGRKGGKLGGPARAANLTAEQRSESARRAVQARWAKAKHETAPVPAEHRSVEAKQVRAPRKASTKATDAAPANAASDRALLDLLHQLKTTNDITKIRALSDQIERIVFHRQFETI